MFPVGDYLRVYQMEVFCVLRLELHNQSNLNVRPDVRLDLLAQIPFPSFVMTFTHEQESDGD